MADASPFENVDPATVEAVRRMCREAGIPPRKEQNDGDR